MKRFFVSSLFLFMTVFAVTSQTFTLYGRVVDADNVKEPVSFATVRLLLNDSVKVAAKTTDNEGYFCMNAEKSGMYKLEVSFIGYETIVRSVELTNDKPKVELGNILMNHDEELLDELEVNALAQELTIKADTFVYHTNAFRVPEGSTIAALIKQLPGLTMDSEGNITFQGKAVNSILVNGKPFIGDSGSAMSNIVSDAVQDVALYEKSDEEKEFAGVYDAEKATVIDLKIKKEYMSSWNMNADAGMGTHHKYMAKAFASNFTDRRRTAIYAQVNNISENQSVDENGNWQNDSWGMNGLYTYRKAGAIISWDNGKGNTSAGFLKFSGEAELGHDNGNYNNISNVEYLLGSAGNHYSYQRNFHSNRNVEVNANIDVTYNIDTLNRLSASLYYNHDNRRYDISQNISTYTVPIDMVNPEKGLVGDDVSDALKALGINSQAQTGLSSFRHNSLNVDTRFTHRLRKEGYSLNAGVRYNLDRGRNSADELSDYRYFNSDTPEVVTRRYNVSPTYMSDLDARLSLDGKIGKHLTFQASYNFSHTRNNDKHTIYRLDRYAHYAQTGLPLGVRPSAADSLAAVIDIENSSNSKTSNSVHSTRFYLFGVWDKFEVRGGATFLYNDERLEYERGGTVYSPTRGYWDVAPMLSLKWKPVANSELSLQYYAYSRRPSLLELLPVTDTSDEMVERVNNPGLKLQLNNNFNLYGRWFNDKRGDSYNLYANCGIYGNSFVDIIQTDPHTGKHRLTKENVDGNCYLSVGLGTEQPLDKERHWTFSAGGGYSFNRSKNYVGALGNELGLSVVLEHSSRAHMSLKWRSGIWNVNLSGVYSGEFARYKETPQYNQNGHTFECSLAPQVDLPFGMKINTSFMFYGRRGYADDIMNHDQLLWNATVSQSLLKNKALTLQLEAVDILHSRTSEYSLIEPSMRHFSRNEVFFSYVMLHAIYRFNIGGK